MKKTISFFMAVIMIFSMFAGINLLVSAESDILDYLTWEINNGEVTITGCDASISGDIVIPNTIEGYPVTTIGECSFLDCSDLTSVTIPDNVTKIWGHPFYGLEEYIVDKNNQYYSSDEYGVLFNKDKTELIRYPNNNTRKEYVIPDSVEKIGIAAFAENFFIERIEIPESVTSIDYYAIGNCIELECIVLPDGITEIPERAFEGCMNLKSITISKNVTSIGPDAFNACYALENIAIYNPECLIYDSSDAIYNTITIYGYEGSTAQAYAEKYDRNFVVIEDVCSHINTETINIAEADCKNNGYTGDVYCKDCEEIISDGETVPAADHKYTENIIKEPTFSQAGLKNNVCENCGDATAEEEIPQLTIEDSEEKENTDTDISIIYPDGTFDGEIEVEVTPVEEGEAYKLISHKEGNYKVTMFDINVTVDGEKVQPNSTVLVKIPLPNGYNPNKCAVYYVADDGTMEELTTYHYKDGYIYFETDHFSYYAILETVENTDKEEDNTESSMSFFDKLIEFFKKIIEFIKNLFA